MEIFQQNMKNFKIIKNLVSYFQDKQPQQNQQKQFNYHEINSSNNLHQNYQNQKDQLDSLIYTEHQDDQKTLDFQLELQDRLLDCLEDQRHLSQYRRSKQSPQTQSMVKKPNTPQDLSIEDMIVGFQQQQIISKSACHFTKTSQNIPQQKFNFKKTQQIQINQLNNVYKQQPIIGSANSLNSFEEKLNNNQNKYNNNQSPKKQNIKKKNRFQKYYQEIQNKKTTQIIKKDEKKIDQFIDEVFKADNQSIKKQRKRSLNKRLINQNNNQTQTKIINQKQQIQQCKQTDTSFNVTSNEISQDFSNSTQNNVILSQVQLKNQNSLEIKNQEYHYSNLINNLNIKDQFNYEIKISQPQNKIQNLQTEIRNESQIQKNIKIQNNQQISDNKITFHKLSPKKQNKKLILKYSLTENNNQFTSKIKLQNKSSFQLGRVRPSNEFMEKSCNQFQPQKQFNNFQNKKISNKYEIKRPSNQFVMKKISTQFQVIKPVFTETQNKFFINIPSNKVLPVFYNEQQNNSIRNKQQHELKKSVSVNFFNSPQPLQENYRNEQQIVLKPKISFNYGNQQRNNNMINNNKPHYINNPVLILEQRKFIQDPPIQFHNFSRSQQEIRFIKSQNLQPQTQQRMPIFLQKLRRINSIFPNLYSKIVHNSSNQIHNDLKNILNAIKSTISVLDMLFNKLVLKANQIQNFAVTVNKSLQISQNQSYLKKVSQQEIIDYFTRSNWQNYKVDQIYYIRPRQRYQKRNLNRIKFSQAIKNFVSNVSHYQKNLYCDLTTQQGKQRYYRIRTKFWEIQKFIKMMSEDLYTFWLTKCNFPYIYEDYLNVIIGNFNFTNQNKKNQILMKIFQGEQQQNSISLSIIGKIVKQKLLC